MATVTSQDRGGDAAPAAGADGLCRSSERPVELRRRRDEAGPCPIRRRRFWGRAMGQRVAVMRMLGHRHARRLFGRPVYPGVVLALIGLVGFLANPATVVLLVLLIAAVEWR